MFTTNNIKSIEIESGKKEARRKEKQSNVIIKWK